VPRSEYSSATLTARLRCGAALVCGDAFIHKHSREETPCDAFLLLRRYLRSRCRPWPWPKETSTGQPEGPPLGLPHTLDRAEIEAAWPFVASDKKRGGASLRLPVVMAPGRAEVKRVPVVELRRALLEGQSG